MRSFPRLKRHAGRDRHVDVRRGERSTRRGCGTYRRTRWWKCPTWRGGAASDAELSVMPTVNTDLTDSQRGRLVRQSTAVRKVLGVLRDRDMLQLLHYKEALRACEATNESQAQNPVGGPGF